MGVGKSMTRVDAWEKVTGGAKYTADLMPQGLLVAKVVRSTIANGVVKSFDLEEALKVPGVVKIVTCFDVPDIQFPTPGHPWSVETAHQDISDRKLLNTRVRVYGDDIAAVIAENDIAAVADAAQDAAGMIGQLFEGSVRGIGVGVVILASAGSGHSEAVADLETLDCSDGKNSFSEVGVQLFEGGIAHAGLHAADDAFDDTAGGIALLHKAVEIF